MDYPKSVPGVGLVDGKFVDENEQTGQQGSLIPAAWGTAVTDEILNVQAEAAIQPNEGKVNQLVSAIRAIAEKRGMLSAVASGTANAITATLDSEFSQLANAQSFSIISKFANTAAVTVALTLGATEIAALPVVRGNNLPLSGGDIPAPGYPMRLCYSAGFGALILLNPATGSGSGGLFASSLTTVNSSGSLLPNMVGGTVVVSAGASNTQTLPSAAAVGVGRRIELLNIGAGAATVARTGADGIVTGSASVNSVLLGTGDSLTLESNGVSTWYAVGGSAQLKSAAAFRSLLSGNGYAQLPSGIIIQAGAASVTAGSYTDVTFPIAFPTACMSVIANPGLAGSAQSQYSGAGNVTLTGFQIAMNQGTGVTNRWFAMGY